MLKRTGKLLFFILLILSRPLFADDVQVDATVSSEEIGLNDTLVYTLSVTCGFNTEPSQIKFPDFQGFKKVSQSESSRMNIVIGGGQTFTKVKIYEIHLLPNRTGQIEIKPATVIVKGKVYQTRSIKINVLSASRSTGGKVQKSPLGRLFQSPFDYDIDDIFPFEFDTKIDDSDIVLQSVVDKRSVYVGEEFVYSLYLLSTISIYDIEQLDIPKFDGAWSEDIYTPKKITAEQKRVGSRVYNVFLLKRKAIFPNKDGVYEIEPASIVVTTVAGFTQRRIQRESTPLRVEVKSLPEKGRPPNFPVYNVGEYKVSYNIAPQKQSIDKPFTLRIVVEGKGNINAFFIPKPKDNPDLRFYDPVVNTELNTDNKVYSGKKIYEYLIFSRRTGKVNIPPLEIDYFRPDTSTYEKVQISGLSIIATESESSQSIVSRVDSSGNTVNVQTIRFVNHTGSKFNGFNIKIFLISALFLPVIYLFIRFVDFIRVIYVHAGFDNEISRNKRRLKKLIAEVERHFKDKNTERFIEGIYLALCIIFNIKYNLMLHGVTRERLREIMTAKQMKNEFINDVEEFLNIYEFIKFSSSGSYQVDLNQLNNKFQQILREIGA